MFPCDRCGEEAADAPGALCVECFNEDQDDDEHDAGLASAITGRSDDFSYLDGDESMVDLGGGMVVPLRELMEDD